MKAPHKLVDRLRSLLEYDKRTGTLRWRVMRYGGPFGVVRPGDEAGYRDPRDGRLYVRVDGKLYLKHRLIWIIVRGEIPEPEIDHRDGNNNNNKWHNLRLADSSQQKMNMALRSDNTSGRRGVVRRGERWIAQIKYRGTKRHIGIYRSVDEADQAYQLEAERLFGEFRRR